MTRLILNSKKKVEALLFSVGKQISIDELSKHCKIRDQEKIKAILKELQQEYSEKDSSLELVDDGNDIWKLTIKDEITKQGEFQDGAVQDRF